MVVAWPFLRPDRYVTGFDTIAYSGPNLDLTLRSMRSGRLLAGWNDAIFGGVPHLGNPQAAAVYAPKWLFAWLQLGTHRASDLLVGLPSACSRPESSCWCGGRWDWRPRPALAAVLVVVGSGQVMIRSLFLEQIMVIAWTPWLLLAIDRVLVGRWRAVAGLALVTALMLTAGHPQPVYLTAWLAGLWALVRAADRAPGAAWARWRPARAFGRRDRRGPAAAEPRPERAVGRGGRAGPRPGRRRGLVGRQPGAAGDAVRRRLRRDHPVTATDARGHDVHRCVGRAAGAGGVGGCRAALAVTGQRPAALDRAGIGAGRLVGIVLGLGPLFLPYRAAFKLVPFFDLARVPARWTLLTVLGAGVLAAVGVDALAGGHVTRTVAWVVGGGALAAALVTAFGPFTLPADRTCWTWALFGAALVVALVAGAWPAARQRDRPVAEGGRAWRRAARRQRAAGRAAVAAVAVLAVELTALQVHSVGRRSETDEPFTAWRTPFADELLRRRPRPRPDPRPARRLPVPGRVAAAERQHRTSSCAASTATTAGSR